MQSGEFTKGSTKVRPGASIADFRAPSLRADSGGRGKEGGWDEGSRRAAAF